MTELKPHIESFASFDHTESAKMPRKINSEAASGFGARLAALRKAAGITQTAFAAEIGISQRMMAYYESPPAHPPANLLPTIAKALDISVDTLLGVEAAKRRTKATDTRLVRRLQEIEKLNVTERRQIIQIIDTFIERGQLKKKVQRAA